VTSRFARPEGLFLKPNQYDRYVRATVAHGERRKAFVPKRSLDDLSKVSGLALINGDADAKTWRLVRRRPCCARPRQTLAAGRLHAYEDIGVASLEAVGLATVALAGKRHRSALGGEWATASCVVIEMCRAPKCRPAHSRRHLYVTSYTEGFSHFVTSMTAPVASGWSVRRVGLAPTGKRRLLTAHANSGHSARAWGTISRPCRTCDPSGNRGARKKYLLSRMGLNPKILRQAQDLASFSALQITQPSLATPTARAV
jgi:hypothetical protein